MSILIHFGHARVDLDSFWTHILDILTTILTHCGHTTAERKILVDETIFLCEPRFLQTGSDSEFSLGYVPSSHPCKFFVVGGLASDAADGDMEKVQTKQKTLISTW